MFVNNTSTSYCLRCSAGPLAAVWRRARHASRRGRRTGTGRIAAACATSPVQAGSPPEPSKPDLAFLRRPGTGSTACLLYTSDAADDLLCVDLGGRRILKKKKNWRIKKS